MPPLNPLVSTSILVLSLLAPAAAQVKNLTPLPDRGLMIFPGRGNAGWSGITRLLFGKESDGEALIELPAGHFQGVGDRSKSGGPQVCSIDGFSLAFQDQRGNTSHTYGFVIRPQAAKGGPDMSATPILEIKNLQSPRGGAGVRGFVVQTFFMNGSTPAPMDVPCQKTYYFGMQVPKDRNWPVDGFSLYESRYPQSQSAATDRGDFCRLPRSVRDRVPNLTWSVTVGKAPVNKLSFRGLTMPFELIPSAPVLQAGAGHQLNGKTFAAFGAAGLYPDIQRKPTGDGLVLRVSDYKLRPSGGNVVLYLSLATGSPLQLGGISGRVYLGSSSLFFLLAAPLPKGSSDTLFELVKPGQIPSALIGSTIYFQGATQPGINQPAALTNLVGVSY